MTAFKPEPLEHPWPAWISVRFPSDLGTPDIKLRIYAHLFTKDDGKATAAINAALMMPG